MINSLETKVGSFSREAGVKYALCHAHLMRTLPKKRVRIVTIHFSNDKHQEVLPLLLVTLGAV